MKKTGMVVVAVVVLGGFLYWASTFSGQQLQFIPGTEVAFLPNGHQQLAAHIHPTLSVTVDGEPEVIPANVGIVGSRMSEMHTHDASGTLHIETATQARLNELSLEDFFDVWGMPVTREGYTLAIFVDGNEVQGIDQVVIRDHTAIQLVYSSEAINS